MDVPKYLYYITKYVCIYTWIFPSAYPSGHLVPSPFSGLACTPIVNTRFNELAMYLLDFLPWTPFSILLFVPHFYYCELVIIRHVPIFAIFVSALNDEFTYWRIQIPRTTWKRLKIYKSLLLLWLKHRKWQGLKCYLFIGHKCTLTRSALT